MNCEHETEGTRCRKRSRLVVSINQWPRAVCYDHASDGMIIAHTPCNCHGPCTYTTRAVAGGAPEQHAALVDALTWWHSDCRHMQLKEPAWVPAARAAIKKATGV